MHTRKLLFGSIVLILLLGILWLSIGASVLLDPGPEPVRVETGSFHSSHWEDGEYQYHGWIQVGNFSQTDEFRFIGARLLFIDETWDTISTYEMGTISLAPSTVIRANVSLSEVPSVVLLQASEIRNPRSMTVYGVGPNGSFAQNSSQTIYTPASDQE